jgi:hypothetical protein
MTNAYKIMVENRKWKRPLGIPKHRWEDNKMGLKRYSM